MRKIKKINGFLVVKFNDREKREYEGTALGEYGVIDAEVYTGNLDIDRGAMEYLAKRYAVPLAPAPRVINKFSKDIAVYNLFSRIGIDEGTDQKTYLNRYNAAIKFLTLVAEGTVSIGTETEDPASAAAGGFKVKSNSRLFTREKMRGM